MNETSTEPEDTNAPANDLYQKARALMDAGNLQDAVAIFGQSVALFPHFKALELMGECLLLLGKPTAAVVPLAAASRLNRQVRAPSLLAKALLQIGEYGLCGEIAEEILAQAPSNRVAKEVLFHPSVVESLAESKRIRQEDANG